jgi:hypothetical protein
VPELGPRGSVRGALSNERPYRELYWSGTRYPERAVGMTKKGQTPSFVAVAFNGRETLKRGQPYAELASSFFGARLHRLRSFHLRERRLRTPGIPK